MMLKPTAQHRNVGDNYNPCAPRLGSVRAKSNRQSRSELLIATYFTELK